MIAKLLLVLAVVIALATAIPVDQANQQVVLTEKATCQTNPPIMPCVQAFFTNFGFSGYPANDSTFITTFETYVQQNDVAGWTNVQTWMKTFVTCAGGHTNFDACVDWHVLMNQCHLPRLDALAYDGQFRVIEYDINAGFNVLTQNWFCIKGVDQHEGPVVQQCRQHFIDQQHNNPNMTCQNLGEFLNCIERPYVTHCGRKVGALKCHEERIIYTILNPDCASHVALHCQGAPNPSEKRILLH